MFRIMLPKFNFKIERWKWNKEYRVYVSTLGNFKNEYKQNIPFKINKNGYLLVKTHCGLKFAHRLVMLTWKPIPNAEELTVDHFNHNKRENTIYNLEWVTEKENQARAARDFVSIQEIDNSNIKRIYAGSKNIKKKYSFNNLSEAVTWFMEKNGDIGTGKVIRIANKIKKAASTGEKYGDLIWTIEK